MMDFAQALCGNLVDKEMNMKANIVPALSYMINSFGNHDEEIKKVVMQNETTKKNFLMVAAGCMVALGYTGKCEDTRGGHWDDRNKKSTEYCKTHFNEFLKMFEDAAGFPIEFKENSGYQYFQHDTLLGKMDTRGMQIADEISYFLRDHPTLQQKMVGIFLRIIAENNLYPGVEPEGFPFI